jgi:NAD(P)-dependent dehydrogenase (short-subunit alcohol dehydrogenase family)
MAALGGRTASAFFPAQAMYPVGADEHRRIVAGGRRHDIDSVAPGLRQGGVRGSRVRRTNRPVRKASYSRDGPAPVSGRSVAREVLRPMISARRGSLVFVSSVNALASSPMRAVYGVAKAGLESLARTLAIETAEYGLRMNTCCMTRMSMTDVAVAGLHEPALVREDHDLGAIAQAELGENA